MLAPFAGEEIEAQGDSDMKLNLVGAGISTRFCLKL